MIYLKRQSADSKWSPVSFLTTLWGRVANPGDIVFLSIKRVGDGQWRDHALTADDGLGDSIADVLRRNPATAHDVYFTPTPFSSEHRLKEFAKPASVLWADIDRGDWRKIPPSMLWRTSPGKTQGLWFLNERLPPERLEHLNRRLTYTIGADKGCWNLGRVLRVVGTVNHKYSRSAEVSPVLMTPCTWDVGKLEGKLARLAPLRAPPAEVEVPDVDREAVLRKHKGRIPNGLLWRLKREPRDDDDRSKVLWSTYHRLFNVGLSVDEVYAVVRNTAWNKFGTTPSGLKRLWREIRKAEGGNSK